MVQNLCQGQANLELRLAVPETISGKNKTKCNTKQIFIKIL